MKNSRYFKIASALLSLSVFAGCASLPVQQGEYDDVYFTSADRTQPKRVVINSEGKGDLGDDVITLEKSSESKVEAQLIDKYNNGAPSEVVYFEEIDPRVGRASELNYDDFVWDYDHEYLKNYDLPLDWDEMDASTFNKIIRNDYSFRNAWYEQYYKGNTAAMDNYLNSSPSSSSPRTSNLNLNIGFGLGFGSFYSPFVSGFSFGNPYYNAWNYSVWTDPFLNRGIFYGRPFYSRFYSSWYDPFYDPFFNYGWAYASWPYRGGFYRNTTVIIADNNYYGSDRNFTRGGRIPSTSVTSVRSDVTNGSGRTRSTAALESSAKTRSTISSGRVSNTSVRPNSVSSTTRSSRSATSVDAALARSSRRISTDLNRTSSRSSSNYSISSRRSSSSVDRYTEYSRSSISRSSIPSYTSNSSSRSSVSFNRNTSSRSNASVFSGRSSSSRTLNYNRNSSSSSRLSNSMFNNSSSSRSSVRSSGSSSSGSSRSSGSSSSSGSSRSSSSSSGGRGGRGGN